MKNGCDRAIAVYDELCGCLLTIGNDEIIIYKNNDIIYSLIPMDQEKHYYYNNVNNILLPDEECLLCIDELLVFQMN